ncbi:MAG: alpha/beta fold hydrolase [Thermomicrobiales bacterium]|nr:alpha/beta fold hydrolase [Thermomicrobiales bacterium]
MPWLIPMPPFTSCTSGHSTISMAAATVLGHLFPADRDPLLAHANEAKQSRLWAGIHYPIDNDIGAAMGDLIGRITIELAGARSHAPVPGGDFASRTEGECMMERLITPHGSTVSYVTYGRGPHLVLVHGGFSDHHTNWQEAAPFLTDRFTVTAIARRGRGESSVTTGHRIEDEAADVAALLRRIGEPVFLLGHSYGALCALEATAMEPGLVRQLVLYEPPSPELLAPEALALLQSFADREDWDGLVETFMRDLLQVPPDEVAAIRATPFWDVWTVDAHASLQDLQAVARYRFVAGRFRSLSMPVLLLIGSESPREIYVTDALAAVLPDARISMLTGQAHEGMTTAPAQFVDALAEHLLAMSPA